MVAESAEKLRTPLLDKVTLPSDLRALSAGLLPELAEELRAELVDAVSVTGGHLGAGLGVVELTLAIHYVFNTPEDRLIFDVGHQCYPHKIITGRRDKIRTLRQQGGLSGFTKRDESVYDPFGAAHSSTSISAGLGMATSSKLQGKDNHVICVIGDGAMSAGMAYEAINNVAATQSRLIIILNDNDMSIAPPVGAMSKYLARLLSSRSFLEMRAFSHRAIHRFLPKFLQPRMLKTEEFMRYFLSGSGTLFEELGLYYIGPVNGHDFDSLLPVLQNVKQMRGNYPVLIHAITQKGKGYAPAEQADDKYHGVNKFHVLSGAQIKPKSNAPSYTSVFGKELLNLANADEKVIGITAAMPDGTGLAMMKEMHPTRYFDVGIAEQHAVTFAAGLATEGYKPFVAIYSTFLQRAYDQVVHDVAIQNLPVRFALDRAGMVGADGQTHAGSFDIGYLASLPNMVVMAPADEAELVHMVHTAHDYDAGPIAFRFPRGEAVGVDMPSAPAILTIGKGRMIQQSSNKVGARVAVLTLGPRLYEAMKASEQLAEHGISLTIADARFAKPVDEALLHELVKNHDYLFTMEEGAIGGFASQILHILTRDDILENIIYRPLYMPDEFIEQASQTVQYSQAALNAEALVGKVKYYLADKIVGYSAAE